MSVSVVSGSALRRWGGVRPEHIAPRMDSPKNESSNIRVCGDDCFAWLGLLVKDPAHVGDVRDSPDERDSAQHTAASQPTRHAAGGDCGSPIDPCIVDIVVGGAAHGGRVVVIRRCGGQTDFLTVDSRDVVDVVHQLAGRRSRSGIGRSDAPFTAGVGSDYHITVDDNVLRSMDGDSVTDLIDA